jgi:formylglycine-generating enzyme required for sulfatase activity
LQEILAASELVRRFPPKDIARQLIDRGLSNDPWWREVALNVAGCYVAATSEAHSVPNLVAFLEALTTLGADESSPQKRFAAVDLAAQVGAEFTSDGAPVRTKVAAAIGSLFDDDRTAMCTGDAHKRVALGKVLTRFGDQRAAVMSVDDMQFCYVPPGPFLMGSDASDPDARDNETCADHDWLANGLDLSYGYLIGRYPVTNAQYMAFVDDGGYANPNWWSAAIRAGRWKDGVLTYVIRYLKYGQTPQTLEDLDELYRNHRDALGERTVETRGPAEQIQAAANLPVSEITFYEAHAYCCWLDARMRDRGVVPDGMRILLPSEAEWEKAARGGISLPERPIWPATLGEWHASLNQISVKLTHNPSPRRRFVWSDDALAADWANTRELKLGATTVVGSFPHDVSPYGCREMEGNTRDWTRSLYGYAPDTLTPARLSFPYPYVLAGASDHGGREDEFAADTVTRVLRGGSWFNSHEFARVAVRSSSYPSGRLSLCGVRVVCAPVPPPVVSDTQ